MNIRQFLLALPLVFGAGAAAAACSSSSTSGGTGGDGGSGTGTSGGTACATLASCCDTITDMSVKGMCTTGVGSKSSSTCTTDLSDLQAAGYCTPGTSGTGTGVGGTSGTGTGTGSHSGSGTGTTGSSSGSGTSSGFSCANPPTTLPTEYVAPTGTPTPTCTSAETTNLGSCAYTDLVTYEDKDATIPDAYINSCNASILATDGSLNACGNCYETNLILGSPFPTTWGYSLGLGIEPTAGDTADQYLVFAGYNFGGCVYAAAKAANDTAGEACGTAYMAFNACQYAVCDSVCPIALSDAGALNPDQTNDLVTCLNDLAPQGACATLGMAAETACFTADGSFNNTYANTCNNLLGQDEQVDGSAAPTAASETNLIGLICGGADAGF